MKRQIKRTGGAVEIKGTRTTKCASCGKPFNANLRDESGRIVCRVSSCDECIEAGKGRWKCQACDGLFTDDELAGLIIDCEGGAWEEDMVVCLSCKARYDKGHFASWDEFRRHITELN